ncbi:proline racemase family protein [Bacteroidota bacterium]
MEIRNISKSWDSASREDWLSIRTIDMHTGGEPLRVIMEGYPEIMGDTILEKRRYVRDNLDNLRKSLMWEPRGHADMYGLLLLPPERPDSDFGVLFMHNEGYSTMCGHATIAITKLAVESGWVEKKSPVTTLKIDAPCGQLTAYANIVNDLVEEVGFDNVPSFVVALDEKIHVGGLGEVTYDLAYGGAFYAYVDARKLGVDLTAGTYRELIEKGMAIKKAVMDKKLNVKHPFEDDLGFLYGTIFTGDPIGKDNHSRNVCIFADGEVDRSATGSGVSGRAAIHYERGELKIGEEIIIQSIIGSTMSVSVKGTIDFGPYKSIIPRISGNAYITGRHEFLIDPEDPLKEGFILR